MGCVVFCGFQFLLFIEKVKRKLNELMCQISPMIEIVLNKILHYCEEINEHLLKKNNKRFSVVMKLT